VRSELSIEPAKKIQAIVYAGKNEDIFNQQKEVIMRMGRLESLGIKAKGEKIKNSRVEIVSGIEMYLPMAKMVDKEKESKKIKEEIEKKTNFIKSLESKLKNEGFVKNAPVSLIKETKDRLKDEKENIVKLNNQLKSLK